MANRGGQFSLKRRQLFAGAACVIGGMKFGSPARPGAGDEVFHSAEAIHQEQVFKANRKRVYDVLTIAEQFQKVVELSGAIQSMSLGSSPTEISREAGGSFNLFGGHILGRQIELIPNRRIVQAWRVSNWDPGVFSIAKFELTEQGDVTKLVFDHTGFPIGSGQHLAEGWTKNYWQPLNKFLA